MNDIVINYVQENAILPPVIFNTASDYYEQTVTIRPYGNAFHQLMFVLSGEGTLTYKKREYPLKKGCAFYIGENVPIEYKGTNKMIVAFITTKGNALTQLAKHYHCNGFLYYPDIDTRKYLLDISAIIAENNSYNKRQGILSLLSYTVYINFFEHQKKTLDEVDKIAVFLDNNYTKNITLNNIASTFGISVSKLCHDFKKRFYYKWFWNIRNCIYSRINIRWNII